MLPGYKTPNSQQPTHCTGGNNPCYLGRVGDQGALHPEYILIPHFRYSIGDVVGVTKIGNIVLREGLEPTSLVFRASVLPVHLHYAYQSMQLLVS